MWLRAVSRVGLVCRGTVYLLVGGVTGTGSPSGIAGSGGLGGHFAAITAITLTAALCMGAPRGGAFVFPYSSSNLFALAGAGPTIALDDHPFPNEPGFRFGLVDEEFAGNRKDLDAPATDAAGKSSVALGLTDLPDATKPLAASADSGARALLPWPAPPTSKH